MKKNLFRDIGITQFEDVSDFRVDTEKIMDIFELKIKADSSSKERKITIMKFKRLIAVAMALVMALGVTALAAEFGDDIIKIITTGHNSFIQVDPDAPHPLPEELKGKIFDENGVMLESLTKDDIDNMYNENGEKITQEMYAQMIEEMTGGSVKVGYEYDAEESEKTFESLEEAEENTVFDIKVPEYLPEGYNIAKIYTYKNDDGSVSGEYMTLVYKNNEGKKITLFERILNENTAFEAGTDGTIEEITVNGRKAVIMNGRSLYLETEDDVSVGIVANDNVAEDELVKIAESVK